MRKRTGWPIACIFVVMLAFAVSGCSKGSKSAMHSQTATTSRETLAAGNRNEGSQPAKPEGTKPAFSVGTMGDDYILPDVAHHVYTEAELSGLTAEELRIARNEIYARHGRTFESGDINAYFSGKSWYHGSTAPDDFNMGVLNQDEKDNLKVIRHEEERKTVCTIPKIGSKEFPRMDGSTATLPLSQAVYRLATGASKKEAESAVIHSGTTEAWEYLIYGGTDLVIAYEPGKRVDEDLKKSGVKLLKKRVGTDGLVFLENESNPVKSLTQSQIVDIYSGRIKNWKDVGGRAGKIEPFQRPENSGSQNLMDKLVMKGQPMAVAPVDHVVGEMGDLIDMVSAYDDTGNALGYSVYYYARNMHQKPRLTFLSIDGVQPSTETIRNESYPYINGFYATVRADEPKDSKAYQLFEWLTGEDGQSLINGLGYVGVKDSCKQMPQGLLEPEKAEIDTATIPLPEGDVILADGSYLYGETGLCVFDSGMHLLKFIHHVAMMTGSPSSGFMECPEDSVIYLLNTKTGKYGNYSIQDDEWKDEGSDGNGQLADQQEEAGETGAAAEEKGEGDVFYDPLVTAFAANHPDILKLYGATLDQVAADYYVDGWSPVICIKNGNVEHYYREDGIHLLDYDTQGKPDEKLPDRFVIPVDAHTAYIQLSSNATLEYRIYRDSKLFKTLTDNQEGKVQDISDHFYTRMRGNYLCFYNYQDEPCAEFLMVSDPFD